MLAIECNPRLHSNITLMDTRRQEAAEAIYRAMETGDMNNNEDKQTIALPDPSQKHVIWTYNELAKLLHGEGERCAYWVISLYCHIRHESYKTQPVSTDTPKNLNVH